MSTQDATFSALMQRVRSGSPEAFQELVDRYGHHVLRVVRSRLAPSMRSKFDSVDFFQSVWACCLENRDRFFSLGEPDELVGFLIKVARDRVIDEYRRRLVLQGSNVKREVPLDPRAPDQPGFISSSPTPSQAAMADECLERILQADSPVARRIVQMKLAGAGNSEIASALHVSRKTVQRTLQELERSNFS